jgi:uncharacterized repeat protein (TIGR01451 family)
MKKQIISMVFGVVVTIMSTVSILPTPTQAAIPRDCDSNAIMRCGAETRTELSGNVKGDIATIYNHYGINKADFGSLVEGTVYKDGRITANGKVVATGAVSTGRQIIGSNSRKVNAGGVTIYERPTSTSFNSASIPAFVKITNGRFQYAIIKSCGNPTKGTPTPIPPKPVIPTPTPKIAITKDVSKAVVDVNEQFTYTVTVRNTGPVDIQNAYVYDKAPASVEFIPNSGSAGTTVSKTEFKVTIASLKKGASVKYTFKAKFPGYVTNAAKNEACVLATKPKTIGACDTATNRPKKPPVTPEECLPGIPIGDVRCEPTPEEPVPLTPVVVTKELPSTGPAEVISGAMGISASTYGAVSYLRSRRNLRDLFRK